MSLILLPHVCRCSFAYGTPPHINRLHCDAPIPVIESLVGPETASTGHQGSSEVFIALCKLTEILGVMLDHLYDLSKSDTPFQALMRPYRRIEVKIYDWEESLPEDLRPQILGTTDLSIQGAANLRLCYLSMKFLLHKMQFDTASLDQASPAEGKVAHQKATQEAAGEISELVVHLRPQDLSDFWLPMGAFLLSSATMFLLRSVADHLNQSNFAEAKTALHLANRLVNELKSHRDNFRWDLGDVCLAQCEPLMHRISQALESGNTASSDINFYDLDAPESAGLDAFGDLIPSIWGTFDFDMSTFNNF
jgi:hypothetical protein